MDDNRAQIKVLLAPLIYFVLTAVVAMIMLVVALMMWLSEMIGSVSIASLIVGGLFAFVAWLIYVLSVKRSIDYIRDRLDTIYDVAFAVRNGYKVALWYFGSFVSEFLRK